MSPLLGLFVSCLTFTTTVSAVHNQHLRLDSNSLQTEKKIVCYFTNWSQYRPKKGKFVPESVDPHLCTHIIFAFGWIKNNKLSAFDQQDDNKPGKKGLFQRVTDLKHQNPRLKVLLAVGGWSFGTEKFKSMASNIYNRRVFIFSALEFLRQREFDGLDIDWEFPRGPEDKKNFVDLLKELREGFEAEAKEKKLPRLLLTAAVSAGADTVRSGYDVPAVAAYVDFLNIMAYDFHGKWESKTGHNAPLFAQATETEWRKQLCVVRDFLSFSLFRDLLPSLLLFSLLSFLSLFHFHLFICVSLSFFSFFPLPGKGISSFSSCSFSHSFLPTFFLTDFYVSSLFSRHPFLVTQFVVSQSSLSPFFWSVYVSETRESSNERAV